MADGGGSIFIDREEAGRELARRLEPYRDESPIVLALPRGGVPVGYEISRTLDAPLDVIIARKLGAPGQPELAVGAVAPGDLRVINERTVRWLGIPDDWIENTAEKELAEIDRRMRLFRGDRPEPDLRGRTAILVDDGIATGMTARAAIRSVRAREPRRVVLAVPVCAAETAKDLADEVDELVSLKTPDDLWAIGFWYEDFHQIPDKEVVGLLGRAHEEHAQEKTPGPEAASKAGTREHPVRVAAGPVVLEGNLTVPEGATGVVLFAHGSGSGRHSPRNRHVAGVLQGAGLATLMIDLLTPDEEEVDLRTAHLRFDVSLLAERLVGATDWLRQNYTTSALRVGYFGASTGAGAALVAAAERPGAVGAVVSRGGRPDLAGEALFRVRAPTLLIVGGNDFPVIGMNQEALEKLETEKKLEIVGGATHLFEEPGTLEEVARLAAGWFLKHLGRP